MTRVPVPVVIYPPNCLNNGLRAGSRSCPSPPSCKRLGKSGSRRATLARRGICGGYEQWSCQMAGMSRCDSELVIFPLFPLKARVSLSPACGAALIKRSRFPADVSPARASEGPSLERPESPSPFLSRAHLSVFGPHHGSPDPLQIRFRFYVFPSFTAKNVCLNYL